MTSRPLIYGLMAEFDNPNDLLAATTRARVEGYRQMDAYTPFPVEGLAEALGFQHTRVPLAMVGEGGEGVGLAVRGGNLHRLGGHEVSCRG